MKVNNLVDQRTFAELLGVGRTTFSKMRKLPWFPDPCYYVGRRARWTGGIAMVAVATWEIQKYARKRQRILRRTLRRRLASLRYNLSLAELGDPHIPINDLRAKLDAYSAALGNALDYCRPPPAFNETLKAALLSAAKQDARNLDCIRSVTERVRAELSKIYADRQGLH